MSATPTQTIELIRQLWSEGYYRKEIARRTGISRSTITRVCADLPQPTEHRGGRKHSVRLRGYTTSEDFEDAFKA